VFTVGVLFAQDPSGKPQSSGSAAEKLPAPATVTVNGVEEPVYIGIGQNGIAPPRCIKQKSPKYSGKARKDKVQGVVLLILVVTREGGVTDIRVKDGLGHGLDEEAVKAVRTWKFTPATKDGKPIAVQIAVEVDFHLY